MTETGRSRSPLEFEAVALFTAEHAVVENNKVYVNGGFWNNLVFASYPARVVGSLVVVISVPARAYLEDHHIAIEIVNPDEEPLPFRIGVDMRVGAMPHLNPGDPSQMSMAASLDGLVLERAGDYWLVLSVDGNELKRYRIRAIQSPPMQLPFDAPGGGDAQEE